MKKTIDDLKPSTKQLVRKVAGDVGIPLVGWGDNDRHRNSQWCFGTAAGPNLAFAWWRSLKADSNGNIYFLNDAGDWADKCRRKGKTQAANKAEDFNNLINACYYQQKPLKVAIVHGDADPDDDDAHEKAEKRELDDDVEWYPHHRDPTTGFIVVMRGVPQPTGFDPSAEYAALAFPDAITPPPTPPSGIMDPPTPPQPPQPSEPPEPPEPPQKTTVTTTAYSRDSDVVRKVKARVVDGCCELCGKQGFLTAKGGYYLEVHHVIPLECDGADSEWNALAICPDEHKQAHYGADRNELRDRMIVILGERFPERFDDLMAMAEKMDSDMQSNEEIEGLIDT